MNTKLHAVTDADGRPLRFFMTAGQVSDYTGAAALLVSLPKAEWLLAGRCPQAGRHPPRHVEDSASRAVSPAAAKSACNCRRVQPVVR